MRHFPGRYTLKPNVFCKLADRLHHLFRDPVSVDVISNVVEGAEVSLNVTSAHSSEIARFAGAPTGPTGAWN